MSPRGTRQTRIHRVETRLYSPDDIKARLIEVRARELADNRTEAQRWLGDPPPERSALAQRLSRIQPAAVIPKLRSQPVDGPHGGRPITRFG